ncbi:MAG: homocysteine S-methyltransferase family protein [Rhodospirillales bacterium]|nr:homocysteine S-methyltransferase family protein [Rhodospirillales bacterium]
MNEKRKTLVLDGGMGRELKRRGAGVDETLWSAGALVRAPAIVRDAHRAFIEAGADVITLNNYAVTPKTLAKGGIAERLDELTRLSAALAGEAREQSGRHVQIAGALPPLSGSFRPDLVDTDATNAAVYRRIVDILAPDVDLFLCETMSSAREARAAASAARAAGARTWVAWTLAPGRPAAKGPRLLSGETLDDALAALDGLGVEAVLFNCCPPEAITAAIPALREKTDLAIGGYANAYQSVPSNWKLEKDGFVPLREDLDVERYARVAQRWLDDGADIVGGCCGIGPAHIAALRTLVENRR